MENFAPFYVGQEVVAIKNSTVTGLFKKGSTFKVLDITMCSCGAWKIDIGFITDAQKIICHKCDVRTISTGVHWAAAISFAPITSTFKSITLSKVLELETPLISVN